MSPGDHQEWASDSVDPPDGTAWDLLVIGAGTAGLVAAKTAARFGASVLLVEQDRPGGDCLWTGCVPSKALLAAAHAAAAVRRADRFGVRVQGLSVDFASVRRHVTRAIGTIEPTDSAETMRSHGASVVRASATLTGAQTAAVGAATVHFRQAVLAAGARPALPPIPGLDEVRPLTNETVFSLDDLPRRLLVLGGGSIGCELGQAFAELGSVVTVVEAAPRLLPREDIDAAELVFASLVESGVTVRTGSAVTSVGQDESGGCARLADGSEVGFDQILVAAGRTPRTDSLGVASAGVELDERGYVRVDKHLRTTNHRVWAAGDLTGHPQFTHTAGVHGALVAANAVLGLRRHVSLATNPRVTFTQPEVAAFGVSLDQAGQHDLTVRTVQHSEVDRAITDGQTSGFSRIVLDGKGRVVGACIVGPRAGESLAELVLAARNGLRARDVAAATHAYPTYGDGVWKASLEQLQSQLHGRTVSRVTSLLGRVRRRRMSL